MTQKTTFLFQFTNIVNNFENTLIKYKEKLHFFDFLASTTIFPHH